jgi:leucyl-tRNA synthetase
MSYGHGAIMAVPAHDERDHAFATRFGLPIVEVVSGGAVPVEEAAHTGDGYLVNSQFLDGLDVESAKTRMIEWLEAHGKGRRGSSIGCATGSSRASAIGASRFPSCGWRTAPRCRCRSTSCRWSCPPSTSTAPLTTASRRWRAPATRGWRCGCPTGGRHARDQHDAAVGRVVLVLPALLDPANDREPWSAEAERYWMPVDLYVGGVEHAVLHLLYARFWHKVLYDCGLVHTPSRFSGSSIRA